MRLEVIQIVESSTLSMFSQVENSVHFHKVMAMTIEKSNPKFEDFFSPRVAANKIVCHGGKLCVAKRQKINVCLPSHVDG